MKNKEALIYKDGVEIKATNRRISLTRLKDGSVGFIFKRTGLKPNAMPAFVKQERGITKTYLVTSREGLYDLYRAIGLYLTHIDGKEAQ
jgi:hypothetical protein